jgi:uncharacterized protein YegL
MEGMEGRRLPVYLVLDTSGSMNGDPIEAVRQGMKALVSELRGDPQSRETAFLSVITFDSHAQQVVPLTDINAFQEPPLDASGTTSLGEALDLLDRAVEKEVKKTTPQQKGDWRPMVFLMTDGQPTDSWEQAADRIKKKKWGNIIGCAAGAGADPQILKRITEIVVQLNNLQPDTLKAYFKWVSASIKQTSKSVGQQGQAPVALPPPPNANIVIVP